MMYSFFLVFGLGPFNKIKYRWQRKKIYGQTKTTVAKRTIRMIFLYSDEEKDKKWKE